MEGETRALGKNGNNRKAGEERLAETEEYRLVRVYLPVLKPDGTIEEVLAAIDTQSNVTFAAREVSTPREWSKGETRMVKGFGTTRSTEPRKFTIIAKGQPRQLNCRLEPKGSLTGGVKVLLSAQHCVELGIDVR